MSQELSEITHADASAMAPMESALEAKVRNPGEAYVRIGNLYGRIWLFGWNDGFTGYEDFVAVYKAVDGRPPADPWGAKVAWKYVKEFGQAIDTGLTWGPGYIAAYVAKDYRRGGSLGYVCSTKVIE